MMSDIIADSITRIRNAGLRKKTATTLLYSKTIEAIMGVLKTKGYIDSYSVNEEGGKKHIEVILKYDEDGKFAINEIKKISKPGRRVYRKSTDIKRFKNGYGTIIITTSKGVLSNEDAHSLGVGGEVLCTVW
ncbi:MAG: 30S ribosomal protein S8 [Deltaproteobacteria bacterium]|nr:MAG: 30S ribosomal protein S8 [Deltaproteobacteria bacterium]